MNKTIKQTHGAIFSDKPSKIQECFGEEIKGANTKNLNRLSLAELQDIAKSLGLMVVDSKSLLVSAIKQELNK